MKQVFVFGSNLAGIHGASAALFAKQNHGAIQGQQDIMQFQLKNIRKYHDS